MLAHVQHPNDFSSTQRKCVLMNTGEAWESEKDAETSKRNAFSG